MAQSFNLKKTLLNNIKNAQEELADFKDKGEKFAIFEGFEDSDDDGFSYIVDTNNHRFIGFFNGSPFFGYMEGLLEKDVSFNKLKHHLKLSEHFTQPALHPNSSSRLELIDLLNLADVNILKMEESLSGLSFEELFELGWERQHFVSRKGWGHQKGVDFLEITLAQDVEIASIKQEGEKWVWGKEIVAKKGEQVQVYLKDRYGGFKDLTMRLPSNVMVNLYKEDIVPQSLPEGVLIASAHQYYTIPHTLNTLTENDLSQEDPTFSQVIQKACEKTGFAYSFTGIDDEPIVYIFNKDGRMVISDYAVLKNGNINDLETPKRTPNQRKAQEEVQKELIYNLSSLEIDASSVNKNADLMLFDYAGVNFELMKKGLSFEQCFNFFDQVAGQRSFNPGFSYNQISEPTPITLLKDINIVMFDEVKCSIVEKNVGQKGDIKEVDSYRTHFLPIGPKQNVYLQKDEYELLSPPMSPTSTTIKTKKEKNQVTSSPRPTPNSN